MTVNVAFSSCVSEGEREGGKEGGQGEREGGREREEGEREGGRGGGGEREGGRRKEEREGGRRKEEREGGRRKEEREGGKEGGGDDDQSSLHTWCSILTLSFDGPFFEAIPPLKNNGNCGVAV